MALRIQKSSTVRAPVIVALYIQMQVLQRFCFLSEVVYQPGGNESSTRDKFIHFALL